MKKIQTLTRSPCCLVIFHDLVSVAVVVCLYGYEKNLRSLVKSGTEKYFSYSMKTHRRNVNDLAIYSVARASSWEYLVKGEPVLMRLQLAVFIWKLH